jgi:predicted transcriptional regulator
LGYIRLETPLEALALITPPNLKKICRKYHLSFKGKREELLKRISENLTIEQIEAEINFKTYMITEAGKEILIKYDEIIKKHLAEL